MRELGSVPRMADFLTPAPLPQTVKKATKEIRLS